MVISAWKKKAVTFYIQKFSFVQPVLEQKKSFQITPQSSKFDEKLLISYNTAGVCGSAPFWVNTESVLCMYMFLENQFVQSTHCIHNIISKSWVSHHAILRLCTARSLRALHMQFQDSVHTHSWRLGICWCDDVHCRMEVSGSILYIHFVSDLLSHMRDLESRLWWPPSIHCDFPTLTARNVSKTERM